MLILGIQLCVEIKSVFTMDVIQSGYQKLVDTLPIPVSVFETIGKCLNMSVISGFNISLMHRMVKNQIWNMDSFDGFIRLCEVKSLFDINNFKAYNTWMF